MSCWFITQDREMVSVVFFLVRVRITWHTEAVAAKTDVPQVFLRFAVE